VPVETSISMPFGKRMRMLEGVEMKVNGEVDGPNSYITNNVMIYEIRPRILAINVKPHSRHPLHRLVGHLTEALRLALSIPESHAPTC